MRTKVLVADPFAIFRAGVTNLLRRESDFAVVEAEDLPAIQKLVGAKCPDIALIDLELPPLGGVAAVEWLEEHCSTHTIVWSFEPTRESVLGAVHAGASGYLRKDISPDGLVRSLRGVVTGQAPLSRDLATLMIEAIHRLRDREGTRERLSALSSRECEVLEHVASGARNRQIASELTISELTVKRHVQNILGKLKVRSRREAGDFYRAAGDDLVGVGRPR
ncbi:MAG: response regulator transcription factor [Actinobacteria bacterium]|nr:MAG: response regulator transcription factor [Actinomycetota bacterium]